jgi:hypothetical protein
MVRLCRIKKLYMSYGFFDAWWQSIVYWYVLTVHCIEQNIARIYSVSSGGQRLNNETFSRMIIDQIR